ncbi:MAG: hypothetical protein HXX09_02920 [Bacteroidetes bacterium]|nr:hypothetical protein [Bacteroidota bacterium]
MKKPSNQVFILVKSLDSHEKTFIKRCLHKESKSSINEDLFDYLCSQSEYNENKMLLSVKKIKKSTVKHCKQNIFDFILKSLELYYAGSTTEQKLNRALFQVRMLKKKKMFSKANKLILSSIEIAEKSGHFLLQLQFIAEQQLLEIESENIADYEQFFLKNSFAKEKLLNSYINAQQNQEKIHLLRRLNIKDGCYPENEKHQITKKINSDIILKSNSNETRNTFIVLQENFIEYYCLLLLNEYSKSKECFKRYLNLYERFNEKIENPEEYLWHLHVGITISIFTDDKNLLWELDKKADNLLTALQVKYKNTEVLVNYIIVKNNVIAFLTHDEDFQEASIRSESLKSVILTTKVKPSIRKIFLANLCQTYLCNGETRKALQCYNLLNNNHEYQNIRNDIDPGMNVLGLAIFFELDSHENIESLVRSCKRKIDFKLQSKIYHHLISFFSEAIKTNEKPKLKLLFEDILQKINSIETSDSESVFFLENTLIGAWLRKKFKFLV